MDKFLFYKIIDDLKEMKYDGYLNLYVNNEPFMDTRIEDWYIYAKQQLPDAKMLLYTNGTLLTKERFERVIPVLLLFAAFCIPFVWILVVTGHSHHNFTLFNFSISLFAISEICRELIIANCKNADI